MVLVGHDVEKIFGLGLGGENAFDGVEGISAVADGSLQGGSPQLPRASSRRPTISVMI